MKVLIINGSATSGKDTFVKLFAKNYSELCLNWSTIDAVKEIALNHLGWDGEKTESSRLFLSELKRIWNTFNDGAFRYMTEKIEKHYSSLSQDQKTKVIYFIHCREPEEIKRFKVKYGEMCQSILLSRNNISIPNNNSDEKVSYYEYDCIIENNKGLTDLEERAIDFMAQLNT
jgi:dephospho-CoA kinase